MIKTDIEIINRFPIFMIVSTNIIFIPMLMGAIILSILAFDFFISSSTIFIFLVLVILNNFIQIQVYGRNTPYRMHISANKVTIKYVSPIKKDRYFDVQKVNVIDISRMALSFRYNIAFVFPNKIIFLHNLSRGMIERIMKIWPEKAIKSSPIMSGGRGVIYKNHIYKKYKINQKGDYYW